MAKLPEIWNSISNQEVSGRDSEEEIIIYDSTGTALQDTAAAALSYEKAKLLNIGQTVNLFD